jgi:hypothetical protein
VADGVRFLWLLKHWVSQNFCKEQFPAPGLPSFVAVRRQDVPRSMRSPDGDGEEEPVDDAYLVGEEQAEAETEES